jgi:hypothetical protein
MVSRQKLAIEKLAQLDRQISDLVALRSQLRSIVASWGQRLDRTPEGQRAGLLEALLQSPSGQDDKR